MREPFKCNHLQHALATSHWMNSHGESGGQDPRNMIMEISLGQITRRFYSQLSSLGKGQRGPFISKPAPHLQPQITLALEELQVDDILHIGIGIGIGAGALHSAMPAKEIP